VPHLASLDETLYSNLLKLKTMKEQEIKEVELTFEVIEDVAGEKRFIPLKPGGSKIPVTLQNIDEYISLLSDYKLNASISSQVIAI